MVYGSDACRDEMNKFILVLVGVSRVDVWSKYVFILGMLYIWISRHWNQLEELMCMCDGKIQICIQNNKVIRYKRHIYIVTTHSHSTMSTTREQVNCQAQITWGLC